MILMNSLLRIMSSLGCLMILYNRLIGFKYFRRSLLSLLGLFPIDFDHFHQLICFLTILNFHGLGERPLSGIRPLHIQIFLLLILDDSYLLAREFLIVPDHASLFIRLSRCQLTVLCSQLLLSRVQLSPPGLQLLDLFLQLCFFSLYRHQLIIFKDSRL